MKSGMRLDCDAMKKVIAVWLCFFTVSLAFAQNHSSSAQPAATPAVAQKSEPLSADTPETTVLGNAFVAPKDWSMQVNGPATILAAPDGDSWIALVDVQGATADEALAAAWRAYKPGAKWPVKVSHDLPDRDGWTRRRTYEYLISPNEKRGVNATLLYSGSSWTVVIEDMSDAVAEKRGAQDALVFGSLLPKGYTRESFAGKKANALDQTRIAELGRFIIQGEKVAGVLAFLSHSSRTARLFSPTDSE